MAGFRRLYVLAIAAQAIATLLMYLAPLVTRATIDAIVNRRRNVVRLSFRPDPVFAAIAEGRRPGEVEPGDFEIEIVPDSDLSDAVGVRDALH